MLAIDFTNGVTGMLATVRATPLYWRVHVFGTRGSAEVLDETTLGAANVPAARRKSISYPPINVLSAELDAFADAVERKRSFPAPEIEVLATLSAFEAALASMASGLPVACDGG
ncbi:MAG: hypothetical protein WDN50_11950 [Bradyrhizobium sp.]